MPTKKSPAKKSPAKKSPGKKPPAKKSPNKSPKKPPAKKSPKKPPAKKPPAKKSPKKPPAKKSPKKSPAKRRPKWVRCQPTAHPTALTEKLNKVLPKVMAKYGLWGLTYPDEFCLTTKQLEELRSGAVDYIQVAEPQDYDRIVDLTTECSIVKEEDHFHDENGRAVVGTAGEEHLVASKGLYRWLKKMLRTDGGKWRNM